MRESARNRAPGWWEVRSKSALRKCLYLPVPWDIVDRLPEGGLGARVAPAAPPRSTPVIDATPPPPKRRDAARDARMMPAVDPALVRRVVREQLAAENAGAWWEGPVAMGALLLVAPPVGLAALWSSTRYSSDARWALTVMTALGMCLASAVAITALALR